MTPGTWIFGCACGALLLVAATLAASGELLAGFVLTQAFFAGVLALLEAR